ncbi:ShlB/FhaC/HecB family hemolysin secretion/activation protein [Polycladidibacter hongkongensis]|uniref:ShlB/FhaC/HecB family hemolysin secretion/activation protein n=1 Tax=Polycladidibacter hongkongensis TaxID=1647556 RepID=UPI0008314AA3|nr:ShlB/FhaC/HecB family hemolysin secretion/activation protein [Pseudovibrio hongkongensis]
MRIRFVPRLAVLALVFACTFVPALAQSLGPAQERLLQEREEERLRQRANNTEVGVKLENEAQLVASEAGAPCFPIGQITLEGSSLLPAKMLKGLVAPHSQSCMGIAQIDNLLRSITQAYIAEGLITSRAYLPDQDIRSGTLHIVVVEGFIEDIVYQEIRQGLARPGPKRKVTLALPIKVGAPLQLRQIEQGVDQMNKLSSANVQLDIAPGTKVGGSQLRLTNQIHDETRLILRGTFNRSLGKLSKSVDVLFEQDDLLGLNDALFLGYSGSATSNSLSGNWRLPVGRTDITLSASYSEDAQLLTSSSLMYSPTLSASLGLDRLLSRSANHKLFWNNTADYVRLRRYINASELAPQELIGWRTGLTKELFEEGSYLSLSAGLRLGHQLEYAGKADGAVYRNFAVVDAQAIYRKGLGKRLSLFASLRGQYSNAPLFSRHQLSLGGLTGSRSLGASSVSGEQGVSASAELTWFAPLSGKCCKQKHGFGAALQEVLDASSLSAFVEGGALRNVASNTNQFGLGAGVALRSRYKDLSIDLYAGAPLRHSKALEKSHFQLGLKVSAKIL